MLDRISSVRRAKMSIREKVTTEVLSWEGVTSASHRFGGVGFLLGKREIGHLHGNRLADLPFPRRVRDELVESGCAKPHHVLPDTGWVSFWIESEHDLPRVIELFRMSYDLAQAAADRRASTGG
jgi:luciferase-like monooxygenase